MAQVNRVQQGPGEQVEGRKTASTGRAEEAVGMEACLARRFKTRKREENRVRRAVQIIIGLADGRGIQYTEGEGDGSRK